ncbi:MAG: aldo/keto reductase [Synechococcaceae cyanobacterium]|nr:aldo/keto reductase [Synechococcaceae cyanobacterium]
MAPPPHRLLHDGTAMPALGLGTWRMEPAQARDVIRTALDLGARHIDCAAIYGNEAAIGEALAARLRGGELNRDQLWITSKLWNDCHAPGQVRPALERTLGDLQLAHLDLYLIHWPVAHRHGVLIPERAEDQISLEQQPLADTWGAMEDLLEAGLVRQIGVSNFSLAKLAALASTARIMPAVNQVERHPWLQQNALLHQCRERGVVLTAYAPLGSGASIGGQSLLEDPQILSIAAAHGASAAQVLIAWGLACGTAVIPKTVHAGRLAENLAAAELQLGNDELAAIAALDRHHRFIEGSFWTLPGGPYTLANLWDEAVAPAP